MQFWQFAQIRIPITSFRTSNMQLWWRSQSPLSNPSFSGLYHSLLNSKNKIYHLCHPDAVRLPVSQILYLLHTPKPVKLYRKSHKLSSSLISHAEPKCLAWLMNQPLTTPVCVVLHLLQDHLLKESLEKGQCKHWLTQVFFTLSQNTGKAAVAAIPASQAAHWVLRM